MILSNASAISSAASLKTLSPRRRPRPALRFKPVTMADIPAISALLSRAGSRTCDYTIGGIYMWIDYFKYQFCIYNDTLFISGVTENHLDLPAFSLPIGRLPLSESIALLSQYCAAKEIPLCLSAVPADRVGEFLALGRWETEALDDWSDYLYDIEALASLSGKKLSKKRNHVNRFMADNPGAHFDRMTPDDVDSLIAAYDSWSSDYDDSPTGRQERRMTIHVLRNLSLYGFDGAVLRLADGTIAAFTLAEVIGDTAYIHIEKMNHEISGAGEAVNTLMARHLLDLYPNLLYANREEDCGDPGLRYAKESYHPLRKLDKFNLRLLR